MVNKAQITVENGGILVYTLALSFLIGRTLISSVVRLSLIGFQI